MFCNHCGYKLDNVEQYNASPNSNAQQTYAQHNNNANSSNNGKYSTAAKIIISITIIAIIVIITVLSTLFVQNIFNISIDTISLSSIMEGISSIFPYILEGIKYTSIFAVVCIIVAQYLLHRRESLKV